MDDVGDAAYENVMEFEVLILAAGRGSRLGDKTSSIPKCLLEVAPGVTLLDTQLTTLLHLFPDTKITIAIGWKGEKIKTHVETSYSHAPIELLEIENFEIYNNAHTLRQVLTKRTKNLGVLQINSDLIFDPNVLREARKHIPKFSPDKAHVFVQTKLCNEEEMKIYLKEDGSIASINKKIEPALAIGEAFGINYYGPLFIEQLIPALAEVLKRSPNAYFEDALDMLFATSSTGTMHTANNGYAIEVDFPADLKTAQKNFSGLIST